jgi:FkbH-like protein
MLRERVDAAIAAGEAPGAESALRELWREAPGHAAAAFVVSRFERLRGELPLRACRLAILRSFTVEPVVPLLRAEAFVHGFDLDVHIGGFNTYAQDLLDPDSELYTFAPEVVLLAIQTRDIAPQLWEGFADLATDEVDEAVDDVVRLFRQLVGAFRLEGAYLVLHTLELPSAPAHGSVLDVATGRSQAAAIGDINAALAELGQTVPAVSVLDYDGLVARRGRDAWHDRRKWLTARMPIAANEQLHLAEEWVRMLHPLTGRVCKAVAVDLDNTLWGGVIGEDGIDGIDLDGEYPGAAYRDVQRALLDLHRRGIMLAVCSKNNVAEALEALERHPGMLLRPEHFSALRISWRDKAQGLAEIAEELSIGLDALAFVDDNPVEREFVRQARPEVSIVELPEDPLRFADAIRRAPVFQRTKLTDEDLNRGRYYAEERQRRTVQQSADSVEDFLRSLELKVEVAPVTLATLPRAAQLTQKTNQFNLTTRRYTEDEVAALAAGGDTRVVTVRSADRFGDNGIVGVAILRLGGDSAEVDSLLLSCRVIGRAIETALLSTLVDDAREAGARRLLGRFIPTEKNVPAREFYAAHGFRDEGDVWVLDLSHQTVASPPWIELVIVSDAMVSSR